MKKDIVILGAGLTGLSLGYHLGNEDYIILEKESRPGGLCRTEEKEEFLFDYCGHLLHLKTDYVKKLVLDNLGKGQFDKIGRSSWIFSNKTYTPYPFQANTYGLPAEVVKECLLGFIDAFTKQKSDNKMELNSFYDWIYYNYGDGIAKHFMMPYNEKLMQSDLRDISVEWIKNYIPDISLEEVVTGAITNQVKPVGYNAIFNYPKNGGIETLVNLFSSRINDNILLNSKIKEIDPKNRTIVLDNGDFIEYSKLVSTIPLIELIKLINNKSNELDILNSKLKHISVLNVNIGLNEPIGMDKHWIYYPEKDYVFYRIGIPSNVSSSLAPEGCSSISTEISLKPSTNNDIKDIKKTVVDDLLKSSIIKSKNSIAVEHSNYIKYAYVIFDLSRKTVVNELFQYLDENNIMSMGRYGGWTYSDMETNINTGKIYSEVLLKT